jgi:anti-sigma B factor antagonist
VSFDASVRNTDGLAVLDMRGEVDSSADAALNEAYQEVIGLGAGRVLLNFADVSYINSTGIALIVGLLAEARGSKRTMLACGLSDHYKEIFEITRIVDFVEIVDDEAAAQAAPTN